MTEPNELDDVTLTDTNLTIWDWITYSTSCPFCGAVVAPPCVCPGCNVGIPADTENDYVRYRVEE
jgi:hypothetical protein